MVPDSVSVTRRSGLRPLPALRTLGVLSVVGKSPTFAVGCAVFLVGLRTGWRAGLSVGFLPFTFCSRRWAGGSGLEGFGSLRRSLNSGLLAMAGSSLLGAGKAGEEGKARTPLEARALVTTR